MTTEHDPRVVEFARARNAGEEPGFSQLDELYWLEAPKIFREAMKSERRRIILDKYQRILVDLGVVDVELMQGDADRIRGQMVRELYLRAPRTILYFSEWLSAMYRRHVLMGSFRETDAQVDAQSKAGRVLAGLQAAYANLGPILERLPGMPPEILARFTSGEMDRLLISMQTNGDPRSDALEQLRSRILIRAREAVEGTPQMALFDQIRKLEAVVLQQGPGETTMRRQESQQLDFKPAFEFVTNELALVKTLIKLGVAGAGITKTHTVLVDDTPRTTKSDIRRLLPILHTVDPSLPDDQIVMLAPFVGVGFFEWDHDTLVVPIQPTREKEEAIAAAFAHYRIMADNLHNRGRLRKKYEEKFGKDDFRRKFIRDYQVWALRVGKGFRGAMDSEAFEFFRAHVGPREEKFYAPGRFLRMTADEKFTRIGELERRIAAADETGHERYEMAVLQALTGKQLSAMKHLVESVRMDPSNERAMFTLGALKQDEGQKDVARNAFDAVVSLDGNSMWSIYASERLKKL